MNLLIFGGTTEGRVLAETLVNQGHRVTVSVATSLGAEELGGIPCTIWEGRLEEAAMEDRVRAFELVIDATHPYAEEVSRYIRKACTKTGVPPAPGIAGGIPGGRLHPGGQLQSGGGIPVWPPRKCADCHRLQGP